LPPGLLAIYLGLREYAKILQIHSQFTALWRISLLWMGSIVAALAVSAFVTVLHPGFFIFNLASLFTLVTVAFFAAQIASAILKSVTPAYARSMRWVRIFTYGVCLGASAYAGLLVVLGQLSGPFLTFALVTCAAPPMLLTMYSGYSFKQETGQ
jgi:hypothetical protein